MPSTSVCIERHVVSSSSPLVFKFYDDYMAYIQAKQQHDLANLVEQQSRLEQSLANISTLTPDNVRGSEKSRSDCLPGLIFAGV